MAPRGIPQGWGGGEESNVDVVSQPVVLTQIARKGRRLRRLSRFSLRIQAMALRHIHTPLYVEQD